MKKQKNKHLYNEQCPKCAKLGKDNAGDNLAVYTNGKWCFSCGYMESEDKLSSFKRKILPVEEEPQPLVVLPEDSSLLFAERAVSWVRQYGLDETDLLKLNAVWSEYEQRLILPIYGDGNRLIAWQGRYFGNLEKPKWWGVGDLNNTYNILGKDSKLILCEDILSAYKVSKVSMAMPLYGSHVGRERFLRLYKLFGYQFDIRIWLDKDKQSEAIKQAKLGQTLGLKCTTIITNLDPKEYTTKEIKEFLK
jgi:hypothetical protein